MTFYLKAAVAAALVALLPPTASASRQRFDLETFDNAPAGPIHPGQIVALEHFRVQTASGTTAAFKPAGQSDELASGLVLGAPEHGGPASIDLLFDTPRESVTFTVVLPPDASALQSTAVVYGAGGEQHQARSTLRFARPMTPDDADKELQIISDKARTTHSQASRLAIDLCRERICSAR